MRVWRYKQIDLKHAFFVVLGKVDWRNFYTVYSFKIIFETRCYERGERIQPAFRPLIIPSYLEDYFLKLLFQRKQANSNRDDSNMLLQLMTVEQKGNLLIWCDFDTAILRNVGAQNIVVLLNWYVETEKSLASNEILASRKKGETFCHSVD